LHFNLRDLIIGLIALILGVDKLLQEFKYELIPFTIPDLAYYIVIVIAGIILLMKGLGMGKHHLYS